MNVSEKMEILLKQRDYIERDYKLIYRDKSHLLAGFSYHSLNLLSWLTVGGLAYLWYYDMPFSEYSDHFSLTANPIETAALTLGVIGVFTVSYWIRQRFVLRLYFSEKKQNYKVVFIGRVPYTCEIRDFPAKSTTFVSKNSAFPWRNTVFNLNGRKAYLFEDNFRTHSDFLAMLAPGETEVL